MKLKDYPEVARLVPEKKELELLPCPCPFCGKKANISSYEHCKYWCSNEDCVMNNGPLTLEAWNTRAIDSLTPLLELEVGMNRDKLIKLLSEFGISSYVEGDANFSSDFIDDIANAIASSNVIEIRKV